MKKLWPYLLIFLVFGCLYFFFQDFKVSDPDRFFHLAVARYQAETGEIFALPQVRGVGWSEFFVDKEFLFHQFLRAGYLSAGELGVWCVAFLMSLSVLWVLYWVAIGFVSSPLVGLFAALTPLLSDTFVLKLMVLRAYIPAIALLLLLIGFLQRQKKWGVFLSAFFFMAFYHAFYLVLIVVGLWWFFGENEKRSLARVGLAGLMAGIVINPYFPHNLQLIWVTIQVATNQLQNVQLNFGPEQEPFRTDHLLLVFRFCFVFMIFGLWSLWNLWRYPQAMDQEKAKKPEYLFLTVLTALFFGGLLVSPRFQEYFIPLVGLYAAVNLALWKNQKKVVSVLVSVFVLITLVAMPYRGFSQQMQSFKSFDQSYFDVIEKAKIKSGSIFNCEWWGDHYPMYLSKDFQVLDVLDPTILKSKDKQIFNTMTDLRLNQVVDPYRLLEIVDYKYVLCSPSTPLFEYIKADPRFQMLSSANNQLESVFLFERKAEVEAVTLWKDAESGKLEDFKTGMVSKSYYHELKPKRCRSWAPQEEGKTGWYVLSGEGFLKIGNRDPFTLGKENRWGEVLLESRALTQDSVWTLCPLEREAERMSMAVFYLSDTDKKHWCSTINCKMISQDAY